MKFELTSAMIEDILFSMEDQGGEFLLDAREGVVVPAGGAGLDGGGGRYFPLPRWEPADGFRLMERFAARLRGAVVSDELSAALNRGRGVFRAFKDALARHPETEKLWFAYKDGEMRRKVAAWHNALREGWGLELIGEEPEDIDGLALEDFRVRDGGPGDRAAAESLREACAAELRDAPDGGEAAAEAIAGMGEWFFPGDVGLVAETAGGDFAGYASAALAPDGCLRVCAVEVRGEYRGLGLGKALLARLLERADGMGIPRATIDLPAGQEFFSRALLRERFRPCAHRYARERPGD